jgi:hypothetical protein
MTITRIHGYPIPNWEKLKKLPIEYLKWRFEYKDGELWQKNSRCKDKIGTIAGKTSGCSNYRKLSVTYQNEVFNFSLHVAVYVMFTENWPEGHVVIDHINNDPSDNRIENLQLISYKDNCLKKKTRSGLKKGVRPAAGGKYRVRIYQRNHEGKKIEKTYGSFLTEDEAHEFWKIKKAELNDIVHT